jgi:hypothetical protein
MIKRILAVLAFLFAASQALAGSGTIAVTPGTGATIATTTDGSGNNLSHVVICDSSAGASCAGVASGLMTVSVGGTLPAFASAPTVVQGAAASSGPWIFTPWIAGAVNSATNGTYVNLLQGNAVVASGNPIFATLEGVVPLPTGAATSALQTTGNTTLTTINSTLGAPLQNSGGSVTANAGTNLNTSALALEGGGNLATIAGGVSGSTFQENLKQVNGVTTLTGTGAVGTGAQRVAVGTDTATLAGAAPASITTAAVPPGGGGPVSMGVATTAAPVDTTTFAYPLSLTTSGNLRVNDAALITALGSPFQAGASIGNTGFNVTGTLPAFAAIPTFKIDQTTPGTTNAVQANAGTNLNTSALALDTSVNGLLLAQGGTITAKTGPLAMGSATTSNPSYTTAQTSPISLDLNGGLRVDCITGCSGGTLSDASSAVATTSTNLGTVAYNYGFNGTTWDQLQVDASKYLKVDCATGCSGGALSDASSAVATTSTNLGTVAYSYGFNGTTWDQLQVDASKNLKTIVNAALPAGTNLIGSVTAVSSGAVTNPTASITTPVTTTTAYTAGQLICTSPTVATCNSGISGAPVAIANSAGGAILSRVRLVAADVVSTGWPLQTIRVDLWSASPVFVTTGDRGAFVTDFSTGAAGHLASFNCIMTASTPNGDGLWSECAPSIGSAATIKLASGTSVFWTLTAVTGSGVVTAAKAFTLTLELLN